jgi:hypothetical protein
MCSCLSFCQPQTARRGTNYRPDSAGEGVVTANALNATRVGTVVVTQSRFRVLGVPAYGAALE